MKRLLVISDYGPSELFAGGLVLKNELAALEKSFFIDYLLFSPHPESYSFRASIPGETYGISKPGERMPLISTKFLKELFGILYQQILISPYVKKQADYLSELISKQNYDVVFVTLEGSQVPQIVALANFQKSKIYLQYWDSEKWWSEVHNFSDYSYKKMMVAYAKIESLELLEKVLVPSLGMRRILENRSPGMKSKVEVIYPPSSSEDFAREIPDELADFLSQKDVNILFSGSLYAIAEIKQFIRALNSVDWKISGKSIGLTMLCAVSPDDQLLSSEHIYLGGRVSPQFVNLVASKVNLLFLPYPLDKATISDSSFPSKLAMYCYHLKNILVIAPKGSSLNEFLVQNNLDQFIVRDSLEASVVNQLINFVENNSLRKDQIAAVSKAYSIHFSKQVFNTRILKIFNVQTERTNIDHQIAKFTPTGNLVITLNLLGRRFLSILRFCKRNLFRLKNAMK
jgi:glycosyltransferase involved in cell wall biosynthesis